VTRYFAITEEGYGYVHIANKEAEARYKECLSFNAFDKLSLLKPFKGAGYEVEVGPGESRTVVIRQNDITGFKMSSQLRMSAVVHGPEKLK